MSTERRRRPTEIWRWPIVFAILVIFGLTSALLGQGGIWWVLSWVELAIPLVVIAVCIHRRRRGVPAAN